jgi:hypothetical protein
MRCKRSVACVLLLCAALCMLGTQAGRTEDEKKSSDIVYITASGETYHRDGCRFLKQSKIKTTRGEAEKSKKQPCKVCKP